MIKGNPKSHEMHESNESRSELRLVPKNRIYDKISRHSKSRKKEKLNTIMIPIRV